MEAMAAGLPIITTKESGLPVIDSINGMIINSKSSTEITDMILKLASNNALRKNIGVNAAELIESQYSWSDYGENVYSIYEQLLTE